MKKIYSTLLAIISSVFTAQAQWIPQTSGLASNDKVKALSVVDQNIVWAYTDLSVLRTINGGTTWTNTPTNILVPPWNTMPYRVHSLHAVDANIAYIIANLYLGHGSNIRIYKTSDGGNTWQRQATAYPNEARIGTVSIADFIYFFDHNNGVIFGDKDSGYFEIYTTTDGGQNWVRVPAANLPPPTMDDLSTPGHLYQAIGDTLWVGVSGMRIFRSIDKGLHWTVANTGITPASGTIRPIIKSISFTDALNGLIIYSHNASTKTALQKTTDGGTVWTDINYSGPIGKTDIEAIPGVPGAYISTSGELNVPGSAYTLDNGNNWFSIENTINHYDIEFFNPATGWTTSDGLIYKYTGNPLAVVNTSLPEPNITVYPNPSSGNFYIKANNNKPYSLQVYDVLGNKIAERLSVTETETRLNLSGLHSGTYLLHLRQGTHKVIKLLSVQ